MSFLSLKFKFFLVIIIIQIVRIIEINCKDVPNLQDTAKKEYHEKHELETFLTSTSRREDFSPTPLTLFIIFVFVRPGSFY